MKVLINSLDIGGAERALETLSRYLDMEVYTLYNISKMNLEYTPITNLKNINGALFYLLLPYFIYKASKFFTKNDIIISHLNQSNFINYILKKIYNNKAVMVVHNLKLNSRIPFENKVMNAADLIVFVSKQMEQDAKKKYNNKTTTIYNPIDVDYILNNSKEDVEIEGEYLLNIGRLIEIKNQELLIKIYAKLKNKIDEKLVIIGKGKLENKLINLCYRLGLRCSKSPSERADVYIFHSRNVYPYIKSARAYIHTSLSEGFGLSLIEALTFNKPVITSDHMYGSRELLGAPFNKIEYPYYTDKGVILPVVKDINEAQIWIDTIPSFLNKYDKVEGESFVRTNFNPSIIANRWKEVINSLA